MTTRLTLTLVAAAWATAAQATELFVATDGNDAWSGKLAAPNDARNDGPFATLERARDETRKLKAAGPVTVLVHGGTYFLTQPFMLQSADSGTPERPIVYAAYPGEKPVFSGGRRIMDWRQGPGNLWQAELP
jgi:hypothetical protein